MTAATADGSTTAQTHVQIGAPPSSRLVVVISANPTATAPSGRSRITVVVRNADLTPASAGRSVLFTTTGGSLSADVAATDSLGVATTTLSTGARAGAITVTAIVGTSEPVSVTVSVA